MHAQQTFAPNKDFKKNPDNSRPPMGTYVLGNLHTANNSSIFAARQPTKWEQLPHNLFLIDANAGTPVKATASFSPNIILRRLHMLGAGIPGLIIDSELSIFVMCLCTVCLCFESVHFILTHNGLLWRQQTHLI